MFLYSKKNFVNKQLGSTLSRTINGSRSCHITVKRFEFFSVETILDRTIDISNNILNCFCTHFEILKILAKQQEKGYCLIFKRNIAHLAHRRALRTLLIASAERSKSLFVPAKFTRTLCIRTTHAPNEVISAIVLPTIRGECAAHRNCSQLFQTCLQRDIGSCRDGEFCDG